MALTYPGSFDAGVSIRLINEIELAIASSLRLDSETHTASVATDAKEFRNPNQLIM